jgi:hypothetical protein
LWFYSELYAFTILVVCRPHSTKSSWAGAIVFKRRAPKEKNFPH